MSTTTTSNVVADSVDTRTDKHMSENRAPNISANDNNVAAESSSVLVNQQAPSNITELLDKLSNCFPKLASDQSEFKPSSVNNSNTSIMADANQVLKHYK